MEIKNKHSTGPKSPGSDKNGVIHSELKRIYQELEKSNYILYQNNSSDKLKVIEHKLKMIETQLRTTEFPDSINESNKPLDKIVVGRINAYRETIYQALSAAYSNILDNSKEIERINRIITNFLEARNGGSEICRILSSIVDRHGNAAISKREKEILTHLLWGKSNKEISRELDISEKTVKNHLWKIYRKLGINNRTQLFHHLICPDTIPT